MVQIESVPECPDTDEPSFTVTVSDGVRKASANAIGLYDAMFMARAKLQEAAAEMQIEAVEISEIPTVPSVPKLKIDPTKLRIPGS
jgi:hypothetical protein